jgi:hypothetical protein
VGLLALAAVGPTRIAASFRLNHAVFLITEGRVVEAATLLADIAAEPKAGSAREAAARVLAELDIVAYPAGASMAAAARAALSPSFARLAAYLWEAEGDGELAAVTPSRAAPTATENTGAARLYSRWERPLRELMEARADHRWRDVLRLADAMPAPRHDGLPRLRSALIPLAARAAYETADLDRLASVIGEGTLAGIRHGDFLGPALFSLMASGRDDEAFLVAREAADVLGTAETMRRAEPFLGGPGGAAGGQARRRAERLATFLHDPAAGLPGAPDDAGDQGLDDPPATAHLPLGGFSVRPGEAAITVRAIVDNTTILTTHDAVPEEGDDTTTTTTPATLAIDFLSAGSVDLDTPEANSRGLVAAEVVLIAKGTIAEGEWPILLLRVQGSTASRFYIATDSPRLYRRTVALDPGRPASFTLSYVNNALSAAADGSEDRNAYVLELAVAPATSPPR